VPADGTQLLSDLGEVPAPGRLFSVRFGLSLYLRATRPPHDVLVLTTMLKRTLIAASILLAAASGPAGAQGAAPFDGSLQRLAEILGALHYLRGICGANEGQKWRNEMQALIDAEAPSGDRRARMIANFNRGYRGFQQSYRTCTPAADLVIRRYLEEGSKIAREMTARYAN
jgi:uncharacterized protein (TIGR02301 family)